MNPTKRHLLNLDTLELEDESSLRQQFEDEEEALWEKWDKMMDGYVEIEDDGIDWFKE